MTERLGHSSPAYTMATCQPVLASIQADAATTFEQLIPENPKVIRATKALVEAVDETVEAREKKPSER